MAKRELWRAVEAQHRVATLRLVDNLAEQQILEQILEQSKPPLPAQAGGSNYLIFTPFRYLSPQPSRFRAANDPGLWYGADEPQTVAAELAYWRWKFLADSDGLREAQVVTEHTFFQGRFAGLEIDLTARPWSSLRALWRDASDYSACQQLAAAVRAHSTPVIAAIRYESARREATACAAVFQMGALSLPARHQQQTWVCKTTLHLVMLTHDSEAFEYPFA
jgi:hypothetical protein